MGHLVMITGTYADFTVRANALTIEEATIAEEIIAVEDMAIDFGPIDITVLIALGLVGD